MISEMVKSDDLVVSDEVSVLHAVIVYLTTCPPPPIPPLHIASMIAIRWGDVEEDVAYEGTQLER